ncbi:MAG TPA: hypothetical protein VFQ45_04705 [Longimicrobium sp.]|nr:hypothetical protein [Longimicrobium sp.]
MSATPDAFELRLFFRADVLGSAATAARLAAELRGAGGGLAPDELLSESGSAPLTPEAVQALYRGRAAPGALHMQSADGVEAEVHGYGPGLDPGSMLLLRVPFARLEGADGGERIAALAEALCRAFPPSYGWGHSAQDVRLGADPHRTRPWAEKAVHEPYWLMVLGAPLVHQLGRAHVEATPAHRVEVLPDGSALLVLTPSPADLLSPEARRAQARTLAHLRPGTDERQALAGLMARSEKLAPVQAEGDPGVAEVFRILLEAAPLDERRALERKLKEVAVPAPDEWLPADQALPSDVDDEGKAVEEYHLQAQTFEAEFHASIPHLIEEPPDALPFIDAHFYLRDHAARRDAREMEELMVPTLGAYLGTALERWLNGRWVPRRNLDESQVIVGDRAWLPFLRVRRFVASRDAALERSLARFYREAERHTGE